MLFRTRVLSCQISIFYVQITRYDMKRRVCNSRECFFSKNNISIEEKKFLTSSIRITVVCKAGRDKLESVSQYVKLKKKEK